MFDTLKETGPTTAGALAEKLDVPASHLAILLDGVVALGLLDQFVDVYELNDAAKRYLVSDGPATMADLVAVAPGPHQNWTRLADTVRNGTPATPIEDDPVAFYVPLVEGTFTTMFRCASRADLKIRYSALEQPHVLDLGAGGAPWSIAILKACTQGTAMINDLPGIIDVAAAKTNEHGVADRCELRARRFSHHRYREGCLRHCRTRSCLPHRRCRRRSPPHPAGLQRAETAGPTAASRLLHRCRTQVQPARRHHGHDHDGQHQKRLDVLPSTVLRVATRRRVCTNSPH